MVMNVSRLEEGDMAPKRKINTMMELSKAIDVSRPTLSKYFQNPKSLRESTVKKIEQKLQEVDYVYNFIATRQNRKSTGLLGVIVPTFKDLFMASLLRSIERAAQNAGFTMIAQSAEGSIDGEIKAVELLRSMGVDGAIIAPQGSSDADEVLRLAINDFPIIFADSKPHDTAVGADFIGTDNRQSIGLIVDYLHRTGSNPKFFRMPNLNLNASSREKAYREKMLELGLEPTFVEANDNYGSWNFEEFGFRIMDEHFNKQRHINDALICANDRIAIGAIRAANRHGLFATSDAKTSKFRIAGHDDHPLSAYVYPALTTVAQDIDGIAEGAVSALQQRISGDRTGESRDLFLEASLTIRESS
jgi:DNA-binding LacI/PurR family transcriptional regulator